MPPKVQFDLKAKIIRILKNTSSLLWFPDLTRELTQSEWRRLKDEFGITTENYGTTRVILNDYHAPRDAVLFFLTSNQNEKLLREKISVEFLPAKIVDYYRKVGVEFYSLEEIFAETPAGGKELTKCINDAFDIIRLLPSLFFTVSCLVKSIHLIKPETDSYDLSFSEPDIPFSIFVSVPRKNTVINLLRVAEAIVHEAMHLQLSLIEKNVPLVASNGELYYSPWKEEFRSPQGILHALYVFRVIDRFFVKLLSGHLKSPEALSHAAARRKEINSQIETIKDFQESGALTPLGNFFCRRLIEEIN